VFTKIGQGHGGIVAATGTIAAVDASARAAAAVDGDEVVSYARALIVAPSENPGGTEDEAAAVAADILRSLGAAPEIVRSPADRPSVVATIGDPDGPCLAWNGHLDVVPAGSPDTWSQPPFAAREVDGRLVGRGAADMKGAIGAALAAAAAIGRAGIDLAGGIAFHLAADEELAGIHGTRVLRDLGLLRQDWCVCGEPTELAIGLAERGGAWITATAYGRAAHGSQPHHGVSAITAMARFVLGLQEALPDLEHPLVGRPSVNPALIEGGSAPNVVAERCEVDVDRRLLPGETDPEAVLEPFRALAARVAAAQPGAEVRVAIREWTDAAEAPADGPLVEAARAAILAETGASAASAGFTGITDARFYINDAKIPTVILGPGSLSVAHTADEWVAIDELVAAARVYARIFASLVGA
jgi:acetylornithine deacetylase/succinyl-diaminopimelate desuccinylase family protein